jgi:hypothetical protein
VKVIGRNDQPRNQERYPLAPSGSAQAKRVLAVFEKLLNEASPEQITAAHMWTKWIKLLDSSLLGAAQSTFLALAFTAHQGGRSVCG